ncbi:FAD-dependent oxidoreductase [Streptantibioticus ferralitis]|uniref:FAD-dependent oxidoreductase n=1 Tax=Streptantibioticus ferralitis TaxID=236510 RepID=A0ABT5Z143_9ACTN|nr:FAD-dependent oxidoreductase [Streptantibioticus ferralitis]MDF2257560.1 FAD-dependent oxidoreductase [Streptantibioticus ferralitis]
MAGRRPAPHPSLGGAATTSSVLTFCGFFDQHREQVVAGVGAEILLRLRRRGVYQELAATSANGDATRSLAEKTVSVDHDAGLNVGWTGNHFVLLDLDTTKLVYDEIDTQAGVNVRLHSTVVDATRDQQGLVSDIVNNSRGGNERITADAFVDASGDGALLAAVGAGLLVVPDGQRQTGTLVCRLANITSDADLSARGIRAALEAHTEKTGIRFARDHGITVRLPVTEPVFLLTVDQRTDALDAEALTRDEISARRKAWEHLHAFREHLDGWQDAHLVETGPQIGIRERRHLLGHEELTHQDVLSGRKRPAESIGRCG